MRVPLSVFTKAFRPNSKVRKTFTCRIRCIERRVSRTRTLVESGWHRYPLRHSLNAHLAINASTNAAIAYHGVRHQPKTGPPYDRLSRSIARSTYGVRVGVPPHSNVEKHV